MSGSGISTLQLCTEFVKLRGTMSLWHCELLRVFVRVTVILRDNLSRQLGRATSALSCLLPTSYRRIPRRDGWSSRGPRDESLSVFESSLLHGLHCAMPCAAAVQHSPIFILLSFVLGCAPQAPRPLSKPPCLGIGHTPQGPLLRSASRRPAPPLSAPRLRGLLQGD
ncbi:unnamed protein product [Symbiodinium sp. CCMP2592]|nr:unnamed protein product [Symbiodinium sp. CCMP2592]